MIRRWLPSEVRSAVIGPRARLYPKADWAPRVFRAKSTLESIARDSVEGYGHGVAVLPEIKAIDLRAHQPASGTWISDPLADAVAFGHEPLVRVRAPLVQAQILETALLTIVNFQTLIATKAARICRVAGDDPVLEFGLRRAQGIDGGLSGDIV